MKTLGALLAGGRSSRFGSDKAEALFKGRRLLELGAEALGSHCREFVIVGRQVPEFCSVEDWPEPHMGPLGGIAGALSYAAKHGFDEVLSIPVDCVSLPPDLRKMLEPAPSCLAGHPVIGLWPVSCLPVLEAILLGDGKKSVKTFARKVGARMIEDPFEPPNINSRADLERLNKSLA